MKNTSEFALPVFHLNGNDPKTLGKEYVNARIALLHFREALASVEFHARDYYPAGEETWSKAREQRFTILDKVREIEHYIDVHAAHCFEKAR